MQAHATSVVCSANEDIFCKPFNKTNVQCKASSEASITSDHMASKLTRKGMNNVGLPLDLACSLRLV